MNMIIQIVTAIALTLSIIVPFGCFFLGEKSKKRYKKSLLRPIMLSNNGLIHWRLKIKSYKKQ